MPTKRPAKKHLVYEAKITSKGQVTIPLEVRKRMGLKTGDKVAFDVGDKATVIKRIRDTDIRDKLEKWRGALGGFPGGVAEINAWLREMRGWNELED